MHRTCAVLAITAGALLMTIGVRAQAPATAKADLKDAAGRTVGEATLSQTPHGVLMVTTLTDIPAGTHAFHIHAVGTCDAPFTSAGGHFNPTSRQHGIENPEGMHAGDMPNIDVPANGHLTFERLVTGVTLGEGANSLFDEDGSALVVHGGADDYQSDPAGNAGPRIACGVVTK